MAQEVANHSQVERKFLRYAMQKLGEPNQEGGFDVTFGLLFTDILFEQIFEGLPGTLFGAKNKKLIKYQAPMLTYPNSKDEIITLKPKKVVDTEEVKKIIIDFIEKHFQSHTKDNLLYLLDAMDESKDVYAKACQSFADTALTEKRK
eukprot:65884_1